jgi:uncharacterized alkaline shock family protein YloU
MENYIDSCENNIYVSEFALQQVIGVAIAETPGVVGIVSKDIRGNIKRFIKKENFWYGVKVKNLNDKIYIACHLIFAYGTPIPTIAKLITENVTKVAKKNLNVDIDKVFIHVDKIILDQ